MRKIETSESPSPLRGYLAVTAAAACWGSSGIFIKLIMTGSGMTATALAFWRDIGAFLLFLTICGLFRRNGLRVHRSDWPWLVCMGVSLGLFHVSWNLGILINGPAVTTVQQAAMPVIVLVVARFVWGERLNWQKLGAAFLIVIGTVFVSGILSTGARPLTVHGLTAGFCVPVFYAGWSMFGKQVRGRYSAEVVLTYAFGIAALVLLPFQFRIGFFWPMSPWIWTWYAGLIGLATGGGFFAYTYGLGHLPAGVASILVMTEILFVSVYSFFLLNEMMTPMESAGAVLVIGGVVLLFQRKERRPDTKRVHHRNLNSKPNEEESGS